MNPGLLLLAITVAVALVFDFLNGFHDAANSIATVVSTRVLSPRLAVIWAAFFNFVAAFLLGTAVAKTIGQGMIRLSDRGGIAISPVLSSHLPFTTWYRSTGIDMRTRSHSAENRRHHAIRQGRSEGRFTTRPRGSLLRS